MSNLTEKKCVPCEGGVPPMPKEEATKLMAELSEVWQLETTRITGTFKLKDFQAAMEFVNKVARLAEDEGHHPNIEIRYNKVIITLYTHAIGGLSENDFIVAAKIDKLI